VPESQVTVRECRDSYHVATLDNDAEAIFEGSLKFVQTHAG
jgi:carboxylesterase